MKTLGCRLKSLRKNMQLTGEEFGAKMNVSKPTVSLWESDKRTPNAEMLQKIANFFDVSVDYLLIGKINTTNDGYYYDTEVAELAEQIKNDPELRILLDAKRNLSKQDMKAIINITKSLLQRERGDE
nr:MAG TPA: repressor protein [Caudoviricetes sp.]